MPDPAAVLAFWTTAGPKRWFRKDARFDEACRAFEPAHHAAARGELDAWRGDARGALALILLLDQIPRNLWRNSAHAFATDALALGAARETVAQGFHLEIGAPMRLFLYMPFEHAEDLAAQDEAVRLIAADGDEGFTRFAQLHRDVIARFGRFPHRNKALGRPTTPEEEAFLASGGFQG